MSASILLKVTIFLSIGMLASCSNGGQAVEVIADRSSDANLKGRAFREALMTQWKARPSQFLTDFTGLCRQTFIGKNLQEASAMMRAAGQLGELAITREPAVLTPAGMTPYSGGLGLHSSLISGAGFNIVMYVSSTAPPSALYVTEARCFIREVSL